MGFGRQWGVERSAAEGAAEGCELVRLTDSAKAGGYACHLYLNVPTFTADGRSLMFISTRGQAESPDWPQWGQNLFRLDLDTGQITQVTALPDACMHAGWFEPKLGQHYFWRKGGRLSRVDLQTGEVVDIWQDDARQRPSMIGLTCDGQHVIYASSMDDGQQQGPPVYTLWKVATATGRRERILSTSFRISHVQCSPTDPDFILYNWECMNPGREDYVPVAQRMWWCNLAGTAGGPFGQQRPNEGRTHEFFSADGRFVGYHGALHDPARPLTDDSVTMFTFGWTSAANGRDCRQLQLPGPIGHAQMSSDGKLICSDRSGDWHIGLIVDDDPPRQVPLYAHASSWKGQHTHPHGQFRPGHRQIVFSTDRALAGGTPGQSDVYLLTVPDGLGG